MHKFTMDNWCAVESYRFTFLACLINSANTYFKSTVHTSLDVRHEKHKYNGYYSKQSNAAKLSVSNMLVMEKKVASNSIYTLKNKGA